MNIEEINKSIADSVRIKYEEDYQNPEDIEFILTYGIMLVFILGISFPVKITKDDRFHEALNCASLYFKLLKIELEKEIKK